jgi:hypothetical protein
MTVGAYNFTASDWLDLDFPLELWLRHTLPLVDELCLVCYCHPEDILPTQELDIPKFKQIYLPYEPNSNLNYSFKAMDLAMRSLDTDWKCQLAIDEFLAERPIFDGLSEKYAYCPTIHNLYGNLETELVGPDSMMMLPFEPSRFHFGNQKLIGDSGDVDLPKGKMDKPVEIWHTGYCRKPQALGNRLRTKVRNEVTGGIGNNIKVLQYTDQAWDYRNWRLLWPQSKLVKVDKLRLPSILLENEARFHQLDW